jgi:hypothetical protein
MPLTTGEQLGHYQIQSLIGKSGHRRGVQGPRHEGRPRSCDQSSARGVGRRSSNGSGQDELLQEVPRGGSLWDWSRDGFLMFRLSGPKGNADLWACRSREIRSPSRFWKASLARRRVIDGRKSRQHTQPGATSCERPRNQVPVPRLRRRRDNAGPPFTVVLNWMVLLEDVSSEHSSHKLIARS